MNRDEQDKGMVVRKYEMFNRITMIIYGILATAMMATTGWVINKVYEHEKRLVAIEANRFTSKDGAEFMKILVEVQKSVAAIPKDIPPTWFLQKVDNIDTRLREVERRIFDD